MKRIKIALTAVAFVTAVGGAFASQAVDIRDAFLFDATAPCPTEEIKQCDNDGVAACTVDLGSGPVQLYGPNVGNTACTIPLNDRP